MSHGEVITGQTVASSRSAAVVTVPDVMVVDADLAPDTQTPRVVLENISSETLLVNDGASTRAVAPGARLVPADATDGAVRTLQVVIQGGVRAVTLALCTVADQAGHTVLVQALVGSR